MLRFQSTVLALSRMASYAAAVVFLLMVALIILEIVLRNLFSTSTYMLDEMVGYGMATMSFLALAYAFETGALIRVGIVVDRLNPRGVARRIVELVAIAATLAIMGIAIEGFGRSVIRDYARGVTSGTMADTPLWIPEGLMLFGMILFEIQLFAYLLRILRGEPPRADSETAAMGA